MSSSMPKLPENINYISVEGVIGVGKTSLCELLAKEFSARIIFEEVNDNPFLPEFYKDSRSMAFKTQVWFLLSRYKQLTENFPQQDLFHKIVVSDYIFAKDRIFASLNLNENEMAMYDSVASIMEKNVQKPDFVIYLQASTDTLLKRINKRGRTFEYNMDRAYLGMLNEMYNHFFFHYTDGPVLIVETDDIDLTNDRPILNDIIKQISVTKWGSNYYRPMKDKDREIVDRMRRRGQLNGDNS